MTNPNVHYYISSGAKNAMRTLRRVQHNGNGMFRDEYIQNLSRDHEIAVEKARAICGTNTLHANDFDLNDWGLGWTPKAWEKKALHALNSGFVPFGKHKGLEMENLDEGYIKWWITKAVASTPIASAMVNKLSEIAENRGYAAKWEAEEAEANAEQEARKNASSWLSVEIGDRPELLLKTIKSFGVDGIYGFYYVNIFETKDGKEVVYNGGTRYEEGECYRNRGTGKKFSEYKGVKQTVISRPHIVARLGKLEA